MASDSSPGGSYTKGYQSIGVPAYAIGTDPYAPATTVEPNYGTADANGYVGVSQDYNSHANGTDRPTPSSAKLSEDGTDDGASESTESSFATSAVTDSYELTVAKDGKAVESGSDDGTVSVKHKEEKKTPPAVKKHSTKSDPKDES